MSGSEESSKSLINSGPERPIQTEHQFQETSNELIAAASGPTDHTDRPRMAVPALKRHSSLKPPISTAALIRSTSGIGGAIVGGKDKESFCRHVLITFEIAQSHAFQHY